MILGGRIEHDCSIERSVGYYLEGVMPLAPFSKAPFHLTLRGVTNNRTDPSVSTVQRNRVTVGMNVVCRLTQSRYPAFH